MEIDCIRPIRAAASAGTIANVYVSGERTSDGDPRIIIDATAMLEITQVPAARICGEYPVKDIARSFSAEARVARPIFVYLKNAQRMIPKRDTTRVSHKRSLGKLVPPKLTVSAGRICATLRGVLEKCITTSDWIVSKIPTEATTFANTGAVRNGLKTRKWHTKPITTHDAIAKKMASGNPTESAI